VNKLGGVAGRFLILNSAMALLIALATAAFATGQDSREKRELTPDQAKAVVTTFLKSPRRCSYR
jgi:hypothetical protein